MNVATAQPTKRAIESGARISIHQGQRPITHLLGHVGTVVEVFRVPRGSCLVRIDSDPNGLRAWFCYRDEIATSAA